jgi:beta-glucosidase
VVSDWGGTHSTAKAVLAGLDMEMPTSTYLAGCAEESGGERRSAHGAPRQHGPPHPAHGIRGGAVRPPAEPGARCLPRSRSSAARGGAIHRAAEKRNGQLPLSAARVKTIAVIGSHADVGVLSGGGSAQVDPMGGNPVPQPPTRGIVRPGCVAPVRAIEGDSGKSAACGRAVRCRNRSGGGGAPGQGIRRCHRVRQPAFERRASDQPSLSLPDNQDALVSAVAAANPHTIVVLETGGAVKMPWIGAVSAATGGLVSGHSRRARPSRISCSAM